MWIMGHLPEKRMAGNQRHVILTCALKSCKGLKNAASLSMDAALLTLDILMQFLNLIHKFAFDIRLNSLLRIRAIGNKWFYV